MYKEETKCWHWNWPGLLTYLLYQSHQEHLQHQVSILRYQSSCCMVRDARRKCSNMSNPDSKVHGANMGPTWGGQDPGGPHVGPMNFAMWKLGYYFTYNVIIFNKKSRTKGHVFLRHSLTWAANRRQIKSGTFMIILGTFLAFSGMLKILTYTINGYL